MRGSRESGSVAAPGTVSAGSSDGGPVPSWAFGFFLVRACLALGFGVIVLVASSGLSKLSTFAALYAVMSALVTLRWASTRRPDGGADGRALVAAALWLVAGAALLLRQPLQGLMGEGVLLDSLGVVAILNGLLRLSGRFHDDQFSRERARRRYRLVIGPLDILLGVALLVADARTAGGVRIALGLWGLATGTFLLWDALMLRRRTPSRPPPSP